MQKVRRFGRWQSYTFHLYQWESHEPMKGVPRAMATDESELTLPEEAWRRAGAGKKKELAGKS